VLSKIGKFIAEKVKAEGNILEKILREDIGCGHRNEFRSNFRQTLVPGDG